MISENDIDLKLREWTAGLEDRDARIAVFNRIRDIPYGILPELNSPAYYIRILEKNMGSCTPKHLLLCSMFQKLGMDVLYVVYPYNWGAFEELYPPELLPLAQQMAPGKHLACKVEINGRYILVDATIDPPLGKIGLPVNMVWDGLSDTLLPVIPVGEEEIYHPCEADFMPPPDLDDNALAFYEGLNRFLESIRHG